MRMLDEKEIRQVAGGKITTTTTTRNPQGHETSGTPGQAQTTTTVSTNPAGSAPPGQNK